MRFSPGAMTRAYGVIMTALAVTALAGCASGARLEGPSWNLTGGKGAAPIPPRPVYAEPPKPASVPPSDRPLPVYRGGRDPVSGRAPGWGGTGHGLGASSPDLSPQPQMQPTTAPLPPPSYRLPPPQVPATPEPGYRAPPPRSSTGAQSRTIEVRPGQSLAMIAAEHRVSIAALMQANGLRDAYVIPGQMLTIPPR